MSSRETQEPTAHKRRTFLKVAGATGAASLTGLAGCTGDGGDGDGDGGAQTTAGGGAVTTTAGPDPVVLGGLVPLSGPLAAELGDSERKGIRAGVDYMNAELGGMAGRPVEVIFEDTATDPGTGREKARKLAEQDDVDAIFGTVSGAVAGTVADFSFQARTPFWMYGGTASITGENCTPTSFRYTTHTVQDALGGAPWALNEFGGNVWIHYANYSYGQAIRNDWQAVIEASSMDTNIVNVTRTPIGHSDFSSYISQISASDADWVLVAVTGGDLISFIRQADQFGLKDQMALVSQNVTTVPLRQAIGEAGIGVYGNIRYDPRHDAPANQELVRVYREQFDETATDPAMVMWASLMIHKQAADAAGSVATEDIVPELEGLSADAPMGPTTIRACDHQALRDVPMGVITEPQEDDWPGIETLSITPANRAIPSCNEIGCDMPSL